MAIVTAYVPTEMPDLSVWYGSVQSYTGSTIVISDGYRTATYTGSFSYSIYGEVFGTLTGISEVFGGSQRYSISNMSADANKMYNAIQIQGNAQLAATIALASADTMNGSSGTDHIRSYAGNDLVRGMSGDDTIEGGTGNDKLFGGAGRDNLFGGSEDDLLVGGGRGDKLDGGSGQDFLKAGKGRDLLTGGTQEDTFFFKKGDGQNKITDFDAAEDIIKIGKGARDFDQLKIVQKGDDVKVLFSDVVIRLLDTEKVDITEDVFIL